MHPFALSVPQQSSARLRAPPTERPVPSSTELPEARARPVPTIRDPRVDMLRGLALLTIFIDHIPYNSLSRLTLRAFGFSDAAEIFVVLAGYSALSAYGPVFERGGRLAGWRKVGRRCAVIWGAHALLLVGSVAIVLLRQRLTGRAPTLLAPLIDDGFAGMLRGLTLKALPAYLDILPLYIVLLACFPLVLFGLRRSVGATLGVSLAIYLAATWGGVNLPNRVDLRAAATVWTFNPFAWQLVFVLGAAMAQGRRTGRGWLERPPPLLKAACVTILLYGFVAVDPWHRWSDLALTLCPRAAFGDDWKCAAAPWRVLHGLALVTLLLQSRCFARFAALPSMAAVKACGRFSLPVFSTGCLLALLGRIAFTDFGPWPPVQLAVNGVGVATQLLLAWRLQGRPAARPRARLAAPAVPEMSA